MLRTCRAPGCRSFAASSFAAYCHTHKRNLRRHGAVDQKAITKTHLRPYLKAVRERIAKNPDMCAQSGARVAEVCQLRGEDIGCEDGIFYMHFRPEAGSLKNRSSERKVPLHPHVRDAGFVAFVRSSGSGPLFFDPKRRRQGAKRPQPKIVAKNVARWIHTLGIDVGLHRRKAPNNAWRHLFHTSAQDAGINESVIEAIMGYAPATVRQSYGEVRLVTSARAAARIPLPGSTSPLTPRSRCTPGHRLGDQTRFSKHRTVTEFGRSRSLMYLRACTLPYMESGCARRVKVKLRSPTKAEGRVARV